MEEEAVPVLVLVVEEVSLLVPVPVLVPVAEEEAVPVLVPLEEEVTPCRLVEVQRHLFEHL